MKEQKLSEMIDKLAQKKAEIEHKERILRDRERKLKDRRFIEVGSIASKFGIDEFDDETLMGAFAEMQERSKQPDTQLEWKQTGVALSTNRRSPLIISFGTDPSDEVKAKLKEMRFGWITFRKEWHGHGTKEEIERLVKEFNGKVDVVKG